MEPMLIEALKQVPALGVLVVLVVYFLRALDRKDAAFLAAIATRDEKQAAMQTRCHEVQDAATAAIRDGAVAQQRLVDATAEKGTLVTAVREAVRTELRERPAA